MKNYSSEEFYSALQTSIYGRQYLNLISTIVFQNRGLRKERGFEIHHVHPKALGGSKEDKKNTVKCTVFEHIQLHILLYRAIPCPETCWPVQMLFGKQYNSLSEIEKISLDKVLVLSEIRQYVRETISKDPEYLQKLSKANKGRKCINKEGTIRYVYSEEEYRKCIEEGWSPGTGRTRSDRTKKLMSERAKNLRYVNNGKEVKRVPVDRVELYVEQGWNLGNLYKHSKGFSKVQSETRKGKIYIYREDKGKLIRPEDFESFKKNGWVKGRRKVNTVC